MEMLQDNKLQELVYEIKSRVMEELHAYKPSNDEEIQEKITDHIFESTRTLCVSAKDKRYLAEFIFNSLRRLDILQPIIDDKAVNDIMINGPNDIFIEKNGKVVKVPVTFENVQKLEDVIQSVVAKANRSVNEANPIVDARLADGSRISVVLPPIALNGPTMTIRKFPDKPLTMEKLIDNGSITVEAADMLAKMVKEKYNIFISGGTGSGKTTFLNALSQFIPRHERIITIEDAAELQIIGLDNLVRLETRNANTEGKGNITIRDLIKASLRMRPDRIIVGEVRGEEALDMLQSFNTGHEGSLSTGHSNSCEDMLKRLEMMVLMAAPLPLEAIRQQIACAIDVLVHLARVEEGYRQVMQIVEMGEYLGGSITINPLFVATRKEVVKAGERRYQLERTSNEFYGK